MGHYIGQRLALSVGQLFAVTVIVFLLMNVLPGDPTNFVLGGVEGNANPEARERLREELGLNRPLPVRYVDWLTGLLTANPGDSLFYGVDTYQLIGKALPVSMQLLVMAIAWAIILGLPLGILSALARGSPIDSIARVAAVSFLAIPSFFLGLLALLYVGVPVGYVRLWEDPIRNLQQFAPAAAIFGLSMAGGIARMTRSSMLEVLSKDYVRTARAKGLLRRTVISRHALRNALVPVISLLGIQIALLLGAMVVIESLFALPGLGNLLVDGLHRRDYVVVQDVVLVLSAWVTIVNLLVDLGYAALDPRVTMDREQGR